jgi:hypothetical protein
MLLKDINLTLPANKFGIRDAHMHALSRQMVSEAYRPLHICWDVWRPGIIGMDTGPTMPPKAI